MSVNVQVIGPQPAGLYGLGRDLGDARAVYAPLVDKAKDALRFLRENATVQRSGMSVIEPLKEA